MKIVNLETFLQLPPGTLYHEYEPCISGPLTIKYDTISAKDWYEQSIDGWPENNGSDELFDRLEVMQETGESFPVRVDSCQRNGLYRDEALFLVYEPEDARKLIELLTNATNP